MNTASLCNSGSKQSPINIDTSNLSQCKNTCSLQFRYLNSNINMFLSENNVVLRYDGNSSIEFRGRTYYLEKISFTNPSSHTVDDNHYPVEMNLYHRNKNKNVIVSAFLQVNDARTDSRGVLDSLNSALKKLRPNRTISEGRNRWNIYDALPLNKTFFVYNGSVLNYPCTENTAWVIFKTPVNCSKLFYNNLCKFSKNNVKKVRPLNGRKVYVNLDESNNKVNNNYSNYSSNNSVSVGRRSGRGSRAGSRPRFPKNSQYRDYSNENGRIFYGDESVYPFYYNYFGLDTLMYKMMALSGFYGEKPYRYISFIVMATLIVIFVLFCIFLVLSYNGVFNPIMQKIHFISTKTQDIFRCMGSKASSAASNAASNAASSVANAASSVANTAANVASTASNVAQTAASTVSSVANAATN